jgi:putative phage-type endonuclease
MLYYIKYNMINNDLNNELFSQKDKDEIQLNISDLINEFIDIYPLSFSNEKFNSMLEEYVYNNIIITLSTIYPNELEYLENIIHEEYDNVKKIYFTTYYPIRSFNYTFIRKYPNVESMSNRIKDIENKPQPTQRTPEWYLFRHNLITASSAWKALKSQSYINQLIVEKCKTIDTSKYDFVNTNSALHHGNKFEDVSIMYYEMMYKTKVKDYGCIKHDKYSFLGASPDGINVDPTSHRYGRMLEIKNPVSREITGIPKEDYWIQMQLQMETCNLNECDFLETSFKEYDDEEEFKKDGTFTYSENNELKGIMIYFIKDGKPFYEYMPMKLSEQDYNTWYESIMEKYNKLTWIKNIYWRMEKCSCVLVLRNKFWFKHAIEKIEEVWNIIEKERISGYDHRLPKKTVRARSNSLNTLQNNNCLINVNKLQNQVIYINTNFEVADSNTETKIIDISNTETKIIDISNTETKIIDISNTNVILDSSGIIHHD